MGTIKDVVNLVETLLAKEFTISTYYGEHKISAKKIGYDFEFNKKKRAFGTCYYIQKKISLSLPLCSENLDKIYPNIQNTILHEIAHAFSVHIYGIKFGKGHGDNWKSIAKQIGCNGLRCFNSDEVNLPKSKYILVCDTCGKETPKHKLTSRINQFACGKCCNQHNNGKFSDKYKLRLLQNF
jgi:predicted SprT family Zn-dependent metalloprotease